MPDFPIMETERLLLRRLELIDAPTIHAYLQIPDIAYNTLFIPYPYPPGAAEEWITRCHTREDRLIFAVVRKADNLFLGAMGVGNEQEHKRGELGYWFGKPNWGQGYASEATRRMIQFGFEGLGLNRIYGGYFSRNPASRRVMEKAGMIYEGTSRQHILKWDEFVDMGTCAILRSDWALR